MISLFGVIVFWSAQVGLIHAMKSSGTFKCSSMISLFCKTVCRSLAPSLLIFKGRFAVNARGLTSAEYD